MRGLDGKRIIVVGGANGIGAATAARLCAEGARVFIADIDAVRGPEMAAKLRASGGQAESAVFDLADPDSISAMVDACVAAFGGIDGLANIAVDVASSHVEREQTIAEMDPALWERSFRVNTTGYALVIKAVIPHMAAAGGGAIVNTSSTAAYGVAPFVPAYSATKAGVHTLTRHVAANFGKANIRCNGVAPGWIMSASNHASTDKAAYDRVVKTLPLNRLGDPADPAAAIAFLLSDDAEWITGQILSVNGGAHFPG